MTKQEKIKEAYGEYWVQVKDRVDPDGWCSDCQIDFNNKGYNTWLEYIPADCKEMHIVYGEPEQWYRPKSLQGIEENNGWISVFGKMPPENSGLYFVYDGKDIDIARMSVLQFRSIKSNEVYSDVTHYQPIVKPKPPLY